MRQIIRLFLPLIGLAVMCFAACGSSGVGSTCQGDDSCNTGLKCIQGKCTVPLCDENRPCVDGKLCKGGLCEVCSNDTDCGQGKICEGGKCLDACSDKNPCTGGKLCQKGRCTSCTDNASCGADKICKEGACITGCADDDGCNGGKICEGERCVDPICEAQTPCPGGQVCDKGRCQSCKDDASCEKGNICKEGGCVKGCRNDQGCAGDTPKCDAKNNRCVACLASQDCKKGEVCRSQTCQACLADKECSKGELCLNDKCTQADCRRTEDCQNGQVCKANQCSTCTDDKECSVGQICKASVCQAGCRDNKGCSSGQVCDTSTQTCQGCVKRSDCKGGLICKQGTCAACSDDKSCETGNLCLNGVCKTGDCRQTSDCKQAGQICRANTCQACTADKECATGELCVSGACLKGDCKTTLDCQNGQVCQSNRCVACSGDKDCLAGQLCLSGACKVANCRKTSDCSNGLVCQANRCVTCGGDKDCATGEICLRGVCAKGNCRSNTDCNNGQVCKQNKCAACNVDKDCSTGKICLSGACKTGDCRSNSDCRQGRLCLSNICSTCANDKECGAGQLCVSGGCVKGNCRKTSDCSSGQVCRASQCSKCLGDSECGAGKICLAGACNAGNCRTFADCSGGQICLSNTCSPCTQNSQCGAGRFCNNGACITGVCAKNSDCAKGLVCKKFQCTICSASTDCVKGGLSGGQVCLNGLCKAGNCLSTSDCSGGKVCLNNQCSACTQDRQCGTGKICDAGVCKTGDCVKNSDCKNRQICKGNRCSACTTNSECGTGYQCVKGGCLTVALVHNGALRWGNSTYAKNCSGYRFVDAGYIAATTSGAYWIKPTSAKEFKVYCDMQTQGGGWTLIAKLTGNSSVMNRTNTQQWRGKNYVGDISTLKSENAIGKSYESVQFSDVMIRSLSTPSKNLGWRHPRTFANMWSIIDAGQRVSDGVRMFGSVSNLDYTGNASRHNDCTALKYGFLTADWNYNFAKMAGHNLAAGHSGGIVGASLFDPNAKYTHTYGTDDGETTRCVTDFSFGSGYYKMDTADDKYNINAHWWGDGNSSTRFFRAHGLFVRTVKPCSTLGGCVAKPAKDCVEILEKTGTKKSGMYWLASAPGKPPYAAYCDMTTQGGGWTLVAKLRGNKPRMNRTNTNQWRNREYLGDMASLRTENALGASYENVEFSDVMIRSLTSPSNHLGWRHPRTFKNMWSIINAGQRVSDGVKLFGSIQNLDYTGSRTRHNDCTALKYGFLTADWNYNFAKMAGHNLAAGHSGGIVGASLFDPNAKYTHTYGPDDGETTRCVTDFSFGSGYYKMDTADDKYNINAHWWGDGNSSTRFFRAHGLFVRRGLKTCKTPGGCILNPATSCKEIYAKDKTSKSGMYWLKNATGKPSYPVYCDMSTEGGGWTLIFKLRGNMPRMNRTNRNQYRNREYLGDMTTMRVENAIGPSYEQIAFTDVMIRSLATASKNLGWRHPKSYSSVWSIVNAGQRISDGVKLFGSVQNLDYSGNSNRHNECKGLKYGFLTADWSYAFQGIAGHSIAHGHSGGIVGASLFDPGAKLRHTYGLDDGKTTRCITDFSLGGGYYKMDTADDKYSINAHWWGDGNSSSNDFRPHALFVR